MQSVGAGSGHNVDHRTAVSAIFRAKLRLQVELLDGINGQQRGGSAADSHLIQSRVVEERIVVVGTVEGVVVGTIAVSVDVELSETTLRAGNAGRIDRGPGRQCDQFAEIATIERELGNQFLVYDLAQHVARGIYDGRFFRHRQLFHSLLHAGQVEVSR